nr:hypothetical protein Hi04_10k_c5801_00023 [uncultured bacterium]
MHKHSTPAWCAPSPRLQIRRERIELPDGDFLDADWIMADGLPVGRPIVVLLHGLTGSIESKYIRGLLCSVRECGWRGVLMHFRGASGEPNRLARGYHSGETGDIDYFVRLLKEREPSTPIATVGFSLGGNVLLKWLGEQKERAPVVTGVAVSVPFDLRICAASIRQGFSRLYQFRLIRNMRRHAEAKFSRMPAPFELPNLHKLKDFFDFDEAMTAPLHGFKDVDDYYDRSSSRQFLRHIGVPTLVIHSVDDPFMSPEVVPTEAELSPLVTLELSKAGGHVAFVAADYRGRAKYWLESRIPAHLEGFFGGGRRG